MQPALSTTSAPPPVPRIGQLSGNLRQGFTTKKQSWNPGPNVVNSTTAIGLRASLFLKGLRSSHRARYYNPETGRFLSRDPEEGNIKTPATLHKYLYGGGDPVNSSDPIGREILFGEGAIDRDFILDTIPSIVRYVGNYVTLQAIPATVDAAQAVAAFISDVASITESNSLLKWFTCNSAAFILAEAIDLVMDSKESGTTKKFDTFLMTSAFTKACQVFVFRQP